MGGYEVTNACCGCLAHRCEDVCCFGALFDREHVAHIDKTKCAKRGRVLQSLAPYTAIINRKRPCEMASR